MSELEKYLIEMLDYDAESKWISYRVKAADANNSHIPHNWVMGRIKSDKSMIESASFKIMAPIFWDNDKEQYCFIAPQRGTYGILDNVLQLVDQVNLEVYLLGANYGKKRRKPKAA